MSFPLQKSSPPIFLLQLPSFFCLFQAKMTRQLEWELSSAPDDSSFLRMIRIVLDNDPSPPRIDSPPLSFVDLWKQRPDGTTLLKPVTPTSHPFAWLSPFFPFSVVFHAHIQKHGWILRRVLPFGGWSDTDIPGAFSPLPLSFFRSELSF